jgi:hypothetical protein
MGLSAIVWMGRLFTLLRASPPPTFSLSLLSKKTSLSLLKLSISINHRFMNVGLFRCLQMTGMEQKFFFEKKGMEPNQPCCEMQEPHLVLCV